MSISYNIFFQILWEIKRRIISLKYHGNRYQCPICKGRFSTFLSSEIFKRENTLCPRCLSIERHRQLFLYLFFKTDIFFNRLNVLHVSPEHSIQKLLVKQKKLSYISIDKDKNAAMKIMDLTNLRFNDNYFDIIICSYVLSHVKNDDIALREIYRVLKQNGIAIILVPIKGNITKEIHRPADNSNNKYKHYHYRQYGKDFVKRLEQHQFIVTIDQFLQTLHPSVQDYYRISTTDSDPQSIYRCQKP